MKSWKKEYPDCESGYGFISILITLVIIGILASIALTHYRSLGLFNQDRTSSESFTRRLDKNLAIESLKKLHTMEISYQIRFHKYGTFDDLLREGYITAGYCAKLGDKGIPYLEYWDIEINPLADSYMLLAVPNRNAHGFEDVPILAMNETGTVWEEEGYDNLDDESEDEEEIPFPFNIPE